MAGWWSCSWTGDRGTWWRAEISRMYFQVVLEDGQLITVFHDLIEDGWYLQTTATPLKKAEPLRVLAPKPVKQPRVSERTQDVG